MVETPPSSAGGVGLIPAQGSKTPTCLGPKKQNINNRSYVVTKSIKTFKMVHVKKKKKLFKKSHLVQ